jgi:hypothetical protein
MALVFVIWSSTNSNCIGWIAVVARLSRGQARAGRIVVQKRSGKVGGLETGGRLAVSALEELFIPQGRENAGQLFRPQPHTPRRAVFESNKEAVVRLWFHFNYVPTHWTNIEQMLRSCQGVYLRGAVFSRQHRQASNNSTA